MTIVVDDQQCQWCGMTSPSDADRCRLCRLPFDGAVQPPQNFQAPAPVTEPAPLLEAPAVAETEPVVAEGSALVAQLPETPDAPVRHASLADSTQDLPTWLATLRSAPAMDAPVPTLEVLTSGGGRDPLQVPLRGTPGHVSSGHRRERRRRARRARLLVTLLLLILAIGVLGVLKFGVPWRLA